MVELFRTTFDNGYTIILRYDEYNPDFTYELQTIVGGHTVYDRFYSALAVLKIISKIQQHSIKAY